MKKATEKSRKIIGIVGAARQLGVSRQHLWYVLRGERTSPTLMKRYRDLNKGTTK